MKIFQSIKGGRLTQGYDCLPSMASYYESAGLARGLHGGYDYGCPIGTPIYWNCDYEAETNYCEIDGKGGLGCAVIVKVEDRVFKFRFWHLSKFASFPGEKLKTGMLIGWTGNTGGSTGPHLHFDVKELKVSPTGKYATLGDYYEQMYPNNGAFGAIRCEEWMKDIFVLDTLSVGDKTNRLLIAIIKTLIYRK